MSYSFGVEKGYVARPPATAQLSVDSADRPNPTTSTPYDFQITRQQSIFNGFFTRVATTEVVVEWCQDNIFDPAEIGVDISGVAQTITILSGTYTVAQVLNQMVSDLNALAVPGYNFSIETSDGQVVIYSGANNLNFEFTSDPDGLLDRMDITMDLNAPIQGVGCPDLRPTRFIDFVCSQLTYPQQLKDATTQQQTRDVLCRFYFAEDSPENYDEYGFPILMGYTRFVRRRIFNPPKYIKWDNNLPVGNLSFQVYGDDGNLLDGTEVNKERNNWLMTLQLQES